MNKRTTYFLVGLIVLVLGACLALGLSQRGASALCSENEGKTYTVTIRNDKPSIATVNGKLCDKLTFVNEDNETREIAFGPHEDHVPYDGVAEKFLNKGQSFSILFNKVGDYHWHDHIHDEVEGFFNVTK